VKKMTLASVLAVAVLATAPSMAVAKDKKPKEEPKPIVLPAPPEGKGQIVFFRPGGMGFAIGCSVNENGEKISSLGAGKYFILVTDPGTHEYTVKSEAKDTLALLVEEGETQYASCKIKMGIIVGRPDIRPASEGDFRNEKKLEMVDVDDMGPAPGAMRPEEVQAALVSQGLAQASTSEDAGS
jgi:hypothetical protein